MTRWTPGASPATVKRPSPSVVAKPLLVRPDGGALTLAVAAGGPGAAVATPGVDPPRGIAKGIAGGPGDDAGDRPAGDHRDGDRRGAADRDGDRRGPADRPRRGVVGLPEVGPGRVALRADAVRAGRQTAHRERTRGIGGGGE